MQLLWCSLRPGFSPPLYGRGKTPNSQVAAALEWMCKHLNMKNASGSLILFAVSKYH